MSLIHFVVENTWLDRAFMPFGWGNGYVALPPEHTLHGLGYDEEAVANLDVHGGITFAEILDVDSLLISEGYVDAKLVGHWVLGFDTAHDGDSLATWSKEAVIKETLRLVQQLENS